MKEFRFDDFCWFFQSVAAEDLNEDLPVAVEVVGIWMVVLDWAGKIPPCPSTTANTNCGWRWLSMTVQSLRRSLGPGRQGKSYWWLIDSNRWWWPGNAQQERRNSSRYRRCSLVSVLVLSSRRTSEWLRWRVSRQTPFILDGSLSQRWIRHLLNRDWPVHTAIRVPAVARRGLVEARLASLSFHLQCWNIIIPPFAPNPFLVLVLKVAHQFVSDSSASSVFPLHLLRSFSHPLQRHPQRA